jgi:hypothetical protein
LQKIDTKENNNQMIIEREIYAGNYVWNGMWMSGGQF